MTFALFYFMCQGAKGPISRRPNWFDAIGSHVNHLFFYFRGPTNADENLQALEDQLLEAGHEAAPEAGGHHSHADHHPDEQHASPEAQTRVSPPTFPV
jgi:hypothetical protein